MESRAGAAWQQAVPMAAVCLEDVGLVDRAVPRHRSRLRSPRSPPGDDHWSPTRLRSAAHDRGREAPSIGDRVTPKTDANGLAHCHRNRGHNREREDHVSCTPCAPTGGKRRSRTGSNGHQPALSRSRSEKHLTWSQTRRLQVDWWSGAGSNCRPSAFQPLISLR
jgi:hypothetical protein